MKRNAENGLLAEPSLIAETVLFPTVRALPRNPVARHAPKIFFHARLTDLKAAATGPVERVFAGTAPADRRSVFTPFFPITAAS
jgi:hypothetical protein